jgi:hypothetical protein
VDKKQTVAASEVFKICFLGFSNPKRRVYGIRSQAQPTNPALRNPKTEVTESQDSTVFMVLRRDPTHAHQIAILSMHGHAQTHQDRRFAP